LKIYKGHFSIANSKGKGNDKGVKNTIQTTYEVRDQIIFFNWFSSCNQLVSPMLGLTDVLCARIAPLLQRLELSFEIRDV
jgi:hypothetical protein